jgi:hypothetical protein
MYGKLPNKIYNLDKICPQVKSKRHPAQFDGILRMSVIPTRNPDKERGNLQQVRETSTFNDSDGKDLKSKFYQSTMDLAQMVSKKDCTIKLNLGSHEGNHFEKVIHLYGTSCNAF